MTTRDGEGAAAKASWGCGQLRTPGAQQGAAQGETPFEKGTASCVTAAGRHHASSCLLQARGPEVFRPIGCLPKVIVALWEPNPCSGSLARRQTRPGKSHVAGRGQRREASLLATRARQAVPLRVLIACAEDLRGDMKQDHVDVFDLLHVVHRGEERGSRRARQFSAIQTDRPTV